MADEDDSDDLFSTPDAWEEEHPDDSGSDYEVVEDSDDDCLGGLVMTYLETASAQLTPDGAILKGMLNVISERDWFDRQIKAAALMRCFVLAFCLRMEAMDQQMSLKWLGETIIEAARADLKAQREAN